MRKRKERREITITMNFSFYFFILYSRISSFPHPALNFLSPSEPGSVHCVQDGSADARLTPRLEVGLACGSCRITL